MNTIEKLASFQVLQDGWHFGFGIRPSEKTIEHARLILGTYIDVGVPATDAFCGSDGEVMVTAYIHDHYIECDIVSPDVVNFLHEGASGSTIKSASVPFSAVNDLIRNAVDGAFGNKWLSSESSTPATTIAVEANSTTMFSRTPAGMGVLRSSTSNAPFNALVESVSTSINFTKAWAVNPLRSGYSSCTISNRPVAGPSYASRTLQSSATRAITTLSVQAISISGALLRPGASATSAFAAKAA